MSKGAVGRLGKEVVEDAGDHGRGVGRLPSGQQGVCRLPHMGQMALHGR